jgi:excisionase family DNA binding protein
MNMPRTKQQPEPTPLPLAPANGGPPLGEVLTLPEAAAYLRLSEADVLRWVHEQGLPARQLGTEWRFCKAAIQDWLSNGAPSALQANKEAWLALAGVWKDDPDLEKIVEEAYRRRGRPITEDGSYKNFSR